MVDAIGVALGSLVAAAVRLDPVREADDLVPTALMAIPLVVITTLMVNLAFGLYRRDWRHASVADLQRIVAAVAAATLISAAVALVVGGVPVGFWPTELLLGLCVVGGSRFAIRAASDHIAARAALAGAAGVEQHRTLLYGAGHVGVLMARSAERNPGAGVDPVGFLDDDPRLWNGHVAGVRVFGGVGVMQEAIAATGATQLLITMPSAKGAVIRASWSVAIESRTQVRTVPALEHLLDGTVDAYRVRRVKVEDLLRRPTATHHASAVEGIFTDKTVLITGAAGSIGSELARQVHALRPRRLILLDRSESPLYLVQRDLEERTELGLGAGEIVSPPWQRGEPDRDGPAGQAEERPDVILHAAAYKHVPMLESHPEDAVQVNVAGTMSILDAAVAGGVERFVLVSTDKAVKPSSVMGASKRIAEMLVLDAARRTGRALRRRALRQRAGFSGQRRADLPGAAGARSSAHRHAPRHDTLLHDHPGGRLARSWTRPPWVRPATCSCSTWVSLSRSWTWRGTWHGWPVGTPTRSPSRSWACGPGEKLHEELFYADEDASRPRPPRSCGRVDDARRWTSASGCGSLILEPLPALDGLGRPRPPGRQGRRGGLGLPGCRRHVRGIE